MKKQFAIAIVAIMLLSVLSTPLKAETLCSYSGPDLSEDLLRLTDFSVIAPSSLKEGDTITVKFNLQNFGQYDLNLGTRGIFAAATDPDNAEVSFGFSYASTTLKVGETLSVNVSRTLDKAGIWTVWPSYHLALATGEKFGLDKWHACPITVEAATLPDLVVGKIECGPGSKLSVSIKNIGSGSLPGGWMAVTEVYFDGVRKGFFDLKNPTSTIGGGIGKPGGSSTYLLAWDITVPVTVRVIVDSTKGIRESNEQNNSREEKVEPLITKLPDLIIDEIKCDRENSRIGYVIKNAAEGLAEANHTTTLYAGGEEMAHEVVGAELKPGATYESWFKEYKWLECATIMVKVCADGYNQIKESNEQNNCLEKTCECVVDTILPVIISGPSVSEVTQTSALICWKTDEASDSLVRYDNRAGKYGSVVEDSNLVKGHCLTLTKLEPATTYHFVVESSDSSGNKVRGRDLSFESISLPDEEKPSLALQLPDKLSGRVPISVDTQDDIGVDRVAFFIDGELAHTDYSPPFELILDTMDLDEGSHKFDVRSIDHAGNIVEVSRKSVVQNQFPVDLSPVHVAIITPESGDDVEIDDCVWMEVEVTHSENSAIRRIECIVVEDDEEHIVWDQDYRCWDIGRIQRCSGEPPLHPNIFFMISEFGLGPHNVRVVAYDFADNSGSRNIVLNFIEPEPLPPSIEVSRDVHGYGNWFDVWLTVRNTGAEGLRDFQIRDACTGFQAIALSPDTAVDYTYYDKRSLVTITPVMEELHPGEIWTFHYYVVPILYSPLLSNDEYVIGRGISTSVVLYTCDGRLYQHIIEPPYSPAVEDVDENEINDLDDAFIRADYLIVTSPESLFRENTDRDSVYLLLQEAATLAKAKNGVLGYLPSSASEYTLKQLICEDPDQGSWNEKMAGPWNSFLGCTILPFDYLLLVGETEIVPSFDLLWGDNTINITDYPYSDIRGDERPELRVGRIIGNTAEELIKPIQASLDVYMGRADYDGSDALMISGPEDTWEDFVKNIETGEVTLSGKGVAIEVFHTDFFITDYQMLAKSLRILGSQTLPSGYESSRGAPFSEDGDVDYLKSKYHNTTKQLAAWMLWAMYELPDSDKIQALNDASYADSLITNARLERALELAEDIRTISVGRGGSNYGWSYRYKHSDWDTDYRHSDWICEQWRANGIKPLTPNKDLIVFNGHGDPGGWCAVLGEWSGIGCPIEPIDFGSSRPIVLAFACDTGNYTELDEELKPVSIARAFLRNDAGVYFGSTEEARCDHGSSMLTEKFWEYWSKSSRIGDTVFDLKTWMIQLNDENWDWTCYEFNLYGDPKFGGE